MQQLLLIGGTGFFGKWLLKTLPDKTKATILSRDPERFRRQWPEFAHHRFIAGDLRDFPLPKEHFDLVIHAGAESHGRAEDENALRSVLVDGTRRALGLSFDRMLYISSGAVYGPQPWELPRLAEDHPLRPNTPYGRGKQEAEELCLASGKATVIARGFAFVGPYLPLDAHFAIGNFIGDCLAGRPIVIRGDGTAVRSYLYAGDLAAWLWRLAEAGVPGRAYNVGSDRETTVLGLAETVRAVAGAKVEIQVRDEAGVGCSRYLPDIGRVERELGLRVKVSLTEAVCRTLEHQRRLQAVSG